jgi:hypothetical protein
MLAGKMVYHPDKPDNTFKYDESVERLRDFGLCPLRQYLSDIPDSNGLNNFFALPNTGWKEYRPEEKCQKSEQSS